MGPEQNDYRFPHIQKGHFLEWKIVFHSNMLYMVLITISSIGSDNGLVPNRRQAIIWINDSLVYCVHMYVHHEVSMIRHETNICVLVLMIVVYPTEHVWHCRQSGFTSFTHHLQEQLRIHLHFSIFNDAIHIFDTISLGYSRNSASHPGLENVWPCCAP